MALTASSRGRREKLLLQYKQRETSPDRAKVVWTEPPSRLNRPVAVPVLYYISRNGLLEHPHFMEVTLSSSQGLFLHDVINRLNLLRGKGMANHYSWSAKRSYKNGYVWQDLEENDFIHPVHGHEYILKGSEIPDPSTSLIVKSSETASSSSSGKQLEVMAKSTDVEPDFPTRSRRRNQSWASIDLPEYKAYKADSSGDLSGKATAEDERLGRRQDAKEELSREEISPPPSNSSPETLESLMKADGRPVLPLSSIQTVDRTAGEHLTLTGGVKTKPPSILMSLISCGSISFRDCGAAAVKDHGFSLVSQYKVPRGGNQTVDDKEYLTGSLVVETAAERTTSLSGFR